VSDYNRPVPEKKPAQAAFEENMMKKSNFIRWCLSVVTGLFFFMAQIQVVQAQTADADMAGYIDPEEAQSFMETLEDTAAKMLVQDAVKYEKAYFDGRRNDWIESNTVKYNSNYLMADWLESDTQRLSEAFMEAAGLSETQANALILTISFAPGAPDSAPMLERSLQSLEMLDHEDTGEFADVSRAEAMSLTGMPSEIRFTGKDGVYSAKHLSYDAEGNLTYAVLQAGTDELILLQQYDSDRHLVIRELMRDEDVLLREELDYNRLGLVTLIRSELSGTGTVETEVTYNERGELLALTRTHQPDNKMLYAVDNEYGYDSRGRVSTCESHAVLPDNGTEYTLHMFFVYDRDGNIITVESDGNSAETYQRDSQGHCTGMISAPGGVYEYTYDDQGAVCRIADTSAGVMPMITEYSEFGDVLSVSRTSIEGQSVVQYSYDEFGRCTGFSEEDGEDVLTCTYELMKQDQ